MTTHLGFWSSLLGAVALSGCALVGGVDGDFKPIGDTTGAGGGAPATCIDGKIDGTETDVDCGGDACSRCADGQKCVTSTDCESNYCAGGACQRSSCHDGLLNGTETDVDCGGGACPPCATGKGCGAPAQCESLVCTKGKCAAPSCRDGVKNGDESSVDCGPSCPCDTGQPCSVADDCKSLLCDHGFCQPAACNDGIKDGSESEVDCGGACPGCPDLANCKKGSDCQSGVCASHKCQPGTCSDGAKNGGETDVDCGGACPGKCPNGGGCAIASDCRSGVCALGQCLAPTCVDGIQNGNETSIDCGGGCPCDDGAGCVTAADCKSAICSAGICQAPSCTDLVKNGGETDKDCGGPCPPCGNNKSCAGDGDCKSGVCTGGACVAGTCSDATVNGSESDVDCGGSCSPCATGKLCGVDADCIGGACIAGVCAPTCTDGLQNEGESDVDCGGPMCGGCSNGKACNGGGDCKSHVCSAGTCTASSCSDGVVGGSESDVDCGGSSCAPCANAKKCVYDDDCASGGCNAGTCGPWVRTYGALSSYSFAPSLAVAPDGTIAVAQETDSPGVDFGGGVLAIPTGQPSKSVLFALTRTGQYAWSEFAETTCTAISSAMIADGSGNLLLAGGTLGASCDFGGGAIAAAPSELFVARYSSAGSNAWAKVFGTPQVASSPSGLAVAPNGDVVVTGYFSDATVTLGSHVLTNPTPGNDEGFVVRLAAGSGNVLWALGFGGPPNQTVGYGVAVDSAGDVLLAGAYDSSVDLGGACAPLSGGFAGFVAKLSSSGNCIWAESPGNTYMSAVAVDANDDVVVTGQSGNEVILGGLDLGGPAGIWTMKLHGNDGSAIWGKSMGALTYSVAGAELALDPAGNAILTGSFPSGSSPDFGGGPLVNQGGNDVFVAAYAAADGHFLFSKAFGGPGDDRGAHVATTVTGSVVVTGIFQDTADFGTGPIAAASPYSSFVLSLGPLP